MGYEIKLLVGEPSKTWEPDYKRVETPEVDGNTLYWPEVKDEKGNPIKTGREKKWFSLMATLDLCKIGDGPLAKLVEKSKVKAKKPKQFYYWYFDGNTEEEKDCYDERFLPVPVSEVVKALEKEIELEEKSADKFHYRRFAWALGLLKAIEEEGSDLKVLFYGH